jgi:hypothetical protein
MWMVNPKILCRQHLLGEHLEIHMFVGALNKKKAVRGYLQGGFLEVHNLFSRHAELAEEMEQRGCEHHSEVDGRWKKAEKDGSVDREASLQELINRCQKCKSRYLNLS